MFHGSHDLQKEDSMYALTLTFTCPNGALIRLRAESTLDGERHGTFDPPFDEEALGAILRALEPGFDPNAVQATETVAALKAAGLPLADDLLAAVGSCLDAALHISKDISSALHTLLGAAQERGEPLHLILKFGQGCDHVAALPWELLQHNGRFLVADNTIVLTRTPLGAAPYTEALEELPLRILLVLSEPLGASPIAPERQARQLAHGLRALTSEGAVVVDELRPPTYDTLIEAVRTGSYHALHFFGHGIYHNGAGHLLFEDPYGCPDLVRADDVGAVLNNSGVRLVVMGACQSAMAGADQWSSTAAALLRAGVPLVVGMQVSMLVKAAQAFTRQLYLSLAAGKDVVRALGDARLPLRRPAYGKTWFIPALYSRALGKPRLFDPSARVSRQAQDEIAKLRALQAEVEHIEEDVSRLGVVEFPDEVAQLRMAQEQLLQARAAWRREVPGGYQPIVSLFYGVPPRSPHFVDRGEVMRQVGQGLEGNQPVVVWGLGGIGKTALVVEAVCRQNWRFPGGVLWLDCSGAPPFDNLLNQMGAFCGHPEVADLEPPKRWTTVRALLARLERCLLVWDNAETVWEQRAVRDFIKSRPQNCGCLLATRDDPEQAGWPTVELGPLPDREMKDLFLALGAAAGVKVVREDLPLIPRILDWLQGHPLALMLVVPLAKKRGLARLWTDLQR